MKLTIPNVLQGRLKCPICGQRLTVGMGFEMDISKAELTAFFSTPNPSPGKLTSEPEPQPFPRVAGFAASLQAVNMDPLLYHAKERHATVILGWLESQPDIVVEFLRDDSPVA